MSAIETLLKVKEQWLQQAVAKGLVTEDELVAAVAKAQAQRSDTAAVLLAAKRLTEEQVATLKAEAAGVAFVDVADYQIDPATLKLVTETVARKHQVLPLYRINNVLTVAMEDPWDAVAIDALRAATGLPIIHPVIGIPQDIRKAIEHYYGMQVVEDASRQAAPSAPELSADNVAELAAKPPAEAANEVSMIKLVDALLSEALEARASDIHLEPDGEHTRVRFRIDGVLQEMKLLPVGLHEALCSRIKILAKLDITEHRLPQDGHIPLTLERSRVDLRISTYPTVSGENVVIRLLDQSAVALQLKDLGLAQEALTQTQGLIQRPHGMLLVTGPTGSGKTTTLYAALAEINSMTKNIMTIEDPVEYHVPLIRQTQINLKAGVTFAAGLRSILRQDPDVIMVGEIRDQETAEIAIHAALTGHLVLSTLHTNDAVGAVTRLIDMGVEPYLMASTLLGIAAQRLVRRVCPDCQEGSRLTKEQRARYPELTVSYRGRGCRACRQSGFLGRIGVFELFLVDEELRAKIASGCSSAALRELAISRGMRTMRADGLPKVQQGLTTLEELDRVVPPEVKAS
ncbi:MAG: type II/IV secretion system protein [Candidatus Omnitrophica bacterium]|nr:type II/IV secretion system protein [Candidatus Omnitrophota bacterium]